MTLLDTNACLHLTLTFGHFIWQGTAILLLCALGRKLMRRCSAASRYAVLSAAFAAMAACPAITAIWIHHHAGTRGVAASTTTIDAAEAAVAPSAPTLLERAPAVNRGPAESLAAGSSGTRSPAMRAHTLLLAYAPQLTLAYLLGATLMSFKLLMSVRGGQRLRLRSCTLTDPTVVRALTRQCRVMRLRVVPAIGWCSSVAAPAVVGVLRPMILLPVCLTTQMTPAQVEMLLAHELAHIKRYDHLFNLLQHLAEVILFFHPAVWVLSSWIRCEREQCCDDLAVGAGGVASTYAESLVRMAELSLQRERVPFAAVALGAGGRLSELGVRVSRLLGSEQREPLHLRRVGTLVIGLLAANTLAFSLLASKAPAAPTGAPASEPTVAVSASPAARALLDRRHHMLGDRPIFRALANDASPVALTIDANIQDKLEAQLAERVRFHAADSALGVVMNVKTGEILAMADYATDSRARPNPERNPLICEPVEPGSVMKPFAMAAILTNRVASRDEMIDCHSGMLWLDGRVLHDAHPYEQLSVDMILAKSSNIGMAILSQRLGKERLYAGLQAFGFDKETGIELPNESVGMMLPLNRWTKSSTSFVCMGQEIAATPMQLIVAFGAICNEGKLLKPRLLADSPAVPGRQVLPTEVARNMVEMMVKTCTEGTGAGCKLDHWQALGKTGTAQLPRQDRTTRGYEPDAYLASFMAAAPASDPQIAVLVMTRHPRKNGYYGGVVALPAVKEVLNFAMSYLGVAREFAGS